MSLMQRIREARTTDAEKLATAFENYSFDAAKPSKSTLQGVGSPAHAGRVRRLGRQREDVRASTQFMFDIVGEVAAADADGGPNTPWATAAKAAMAAQTVTARPNYTPKTF